jgi:hypothetical protein
MTDVERPAGYLPEDVAARLRAVLMPVDSDELRRDITIVCEAAFAAGNATGHRRGVEEGRYVMIRQTVAALLAEIAERADAAVPAVPAPRATDSALSSLEPDPREWTREDRTP